MTIGAGVVRRRDIVVIGGSAGAVEAMAELVRGLPEGFPAAVFAVVHFPDRVTSLLPTILSRAGTLPAHHARDGEAIMPGRIYVAPPGWHLLLRPGLVQLSTGPKENGHRPAIDVLFRSAAQAYGPQVIGVVLSGNLDDGAAGLRHIQRHGGITIVQDPATAVYPGMPESALRSLTPDHVVALSELPACLCELAGRPVEGMSDELLVPESEAMTPSNEPREPAGSSTAEEMARTDDRRVQPGLPSTLTCPECHGILWEVRDGDSVQFRCRVGHAFSIDTLVVEQAEQLEGALWAALRALEEHAALNRRLAARAYDHEQVRSAAAFTELAVTAEHNAAVIRGALDAAHRPSVPPAA